MSTTDRRDDPALHQVDPSTGLQKTYLVLSESERARGFVEPIRQTYAHVGSASRLGCGGHTTMGLAIAETYARNPAFYGGTYCATCRQHLPVGPQGDFVWVENGRETDQRVGTIRPERQARATVDCALPLGHPGPCVDDAPTATDDLLDARVRAFQEGWASVPAGKPGDRTRAGIAALDRHDAHEAMNATEPDPYV